MSWRVALALALMLLTSATQGAQLLLLVPLMQLVGLDVQQGSIGWLAQSVAGAFEFAGVPLTLVSVLGAFLVLTALLASLSRLQTVYIFKLQQDFVATLRQRLYRAIANVDWLTFSRTRSSTFTHALTNELERVGSATASALLVISNSLLVLVYILLALRLSATMTGMVFAAGLILVLVLRRKTSRAHGIGKEMSEVGDMLYSASTEHLSGMKTVKSYGVEERNTKIFSELSDQVARVYTRGISNTAATTFWFTVSSAAILSIILYASVEVLGMTAAELLLLLFLFNRMIPLFNRIQNYYQLYLNQLPAFTGVMELQARCEAAAEPQPETSEAVELREGIQFEGVSFSYGGEGSVAAVRELDLTIQAQKTTAIAGPSGAGKSTIADLVMGLILPYRGRVVVDGKPLSPERLKSWRE
jgi:ATP-binding cassette, subfamily C, bacterial